MKPDILPNGELFDVFRCRNLVWWSNAEPEYTTDRTGLYSEWMKRIHLPDTTGKIVCEVCPGAYGGILHAMNFTCKEKIYIDLLMDDFIELAYIRWPKALYINAPVEDMPIDDNAADILIGFNSLCHGWDIYTAIRECMRISKECYLSFDCRNKNDKDHYQHIDHEKIIEFIYGLNCSKCVCVARDGNNLVNIDLVIKK